MLQNGELFILCLELFNLEENFFEKKKFSTI